MKRLSKKEVNTHIL